MEVTQWMTNITHAAQQGAQALTELARPLAGFSMPAVHDLSITALAAAVVTLGVVMLLELRTLAALRRSVDTQLERVFEQLDLIRYDHVQLLEVHARASGLAATAAVGARAQATATTDSMPMSAPSAAPLAPAAIAAGEARLLASLAEARARRAVTIRAEASKLSPVAR